jgi:hypothetical protein
MAGSCAATARSLLQNQGRRDWNRRRNRLVAVPERNTPVPIGPSSRPRDPIHVIPMALALALAAFAGGALGIVWHKLAGDDKPAETATAPQP